jgi:hypothetical protein
VSSRVSRGGRFRTLGINDEIDDEGLEELYERGINGTWMVEQAEEEGAPQCAPLLLTLSATTGRTPAGRPPGQCTDRSARRRCHRSSAAPDRRTPEQQTPREPLPRPLGRAFSAACFLLYSPRRFT